MSNKGNGSNKGHQHKPTYLLPRVQVKQHEAENETTPINTKVFSDEKFSSEITSEISRRNTRKNICPGRNLNSDEINKRLDEAKLQIRRKSLYRQERREQQELGLYYAEEIRQGRIRQLECPRVHCAYLEGEEKIESEEYKKKLRSAINDAIDDEKEHEQRRLRQVGTKQSQEILENNTWNRFYLLNGIRALMVAKIAMEIYHQSATPFIATNDYTHP